MKDFFLFAGPNGSGKSTIIGKNEPYFSDNHIQYLNADYCARADPDIAKMPEGTEKSVRAQKETERRLEEMISAGLSFVWETVFSHESRLDIMKFAKKKGYRIHLQYITTKNPDINVARVHKRYVQGGHDVPEEKIRGRYGRSVTLLPEMIVIADEVLVYDNSYENTNPTLLFQKFMKSVDDREPEMIVWQPDDEDLADWVTMYVLNPLFEKDICVQCYTLI